jgi:hypothetical protein
MSIPFTSATKSLHEQAIECIIQATDAAMDRQQQQVKMYTTQAKMFAEMIARKLKAMGMHRQAVDYLKALDEHINRVWVINERAQADHTRNLVEKVKKVTGLRMKKAEKCEKCGEKLTKDGTCTCGMMTKADGIKKINPFSSASPARREYMSTGVVNPTMSLGHVKPHPMHQYKMLHELSPAHQTQVQQKFPQGEHSRYAYPVHRETGELIHGQRIPLPPGQAIRAQAHAFKELKPEHKAGNWVTINAPGHAHHGRGGVVMSPNPNLPGKVGVQYGSAPHQSVWVEHHQVKLGRPTTKMEKAVQTIYNIRKAFFK